MIILQTERLILRRLQESDAAFMLVLLNDPDFLANIGDRGVRTLDDSMKYLREGPMASYALHGHGLYRVELRSSGAPAGICGLLHRESLKEVDVGFAFLPEFRGCGYGFESASAVLEYGREVLGLQRIVGFTSSDNAGSLRILQKLGLTYEGEVRLKDDGELVGLYS